ncbi:ribonuclease P protein subunit p25-like protein [Pungitius pungitius]|uniref:ribonuclease P protein subunit p25-like protein n=1 Tax=Pungitius pungitius TaxID=134920 RepID=UPI002E0EBE78
MENYRKTRSVELPSVCPFPALPPDTPEVRVRDGSKIRHPLRFALSRMEERRAAGSGATEGHACRQIVLTASGKGVSKAITCAEMVKRRVGGLHQLTQLQFSTVEEVWDPLEATAGLDSLTVSRNLPNIWILLSRDTLDRSQPGYQEPGRHDNLWAHEEEAGGPRSGSKRKKAGGGGGGGGAAARGGGAGKGRRPSRESKDRSKLTVDVKST